MVLVPRTFPQVRTPCTARSAWAGFRVDGPDGRIGVVRAVRPGPTAAAQRLVVTAGLFIRTTVSIPVADVHFVDAKRRRVVVGSTPPAAPRGTGPRALGGRKPASSGRHR